MGLIKRIWKECFRYRLSGTALTICMVLTMIVSFYGVTIYKNAYHEDIEKGENRYRYQTGFSCVIKSVEDIPRLPDGVLCNLKLIDAQTYLDKQNITRPSDIIINFYEDNTPLLAGSFPTKTDVMKDELIVVAGNGISSAITDGYIEIFGESYKVVGIAGSKNSVLYDYYLFLYFDCLGDKMFSRIMNNPYNEKGVEFLLQSNVVNTEDIYEEYIKNKYPAIKTNVNHLANPSAMPDSDELEFLIMIYVFSFISMSVVVQFWLEQRKQEMQICRAFGYSDSQIIHRIAYSFMCISALGLLVSVISLLVFSAMLGKYYQEYRLHFSTEVVLPYFIIIFVSVYLAYISAVRVLKRIKVISK